MVPYHKQLEMLIESLHGRRPKLLLHSCCAPCSSSVIEYLDPYFDITLYFCNPNMDSLAEYERRAEELKRLVREMDPVYPIDTVISPYRHECFEEIAEGLEECPERGQRCLRCYELRLRKTFEYMRETGGFDYFATTLTLSPLKSAAAINGVGAGISENYLPSDFKKKNGFLRSIQLSEEYCLYRQDYCGCKYSKKR